MLEIWQYTITSYQLHDQGTYASVIADLSLHAHWHAEITWVLSNGTPGPPERDAMSA